MKKILIDCQGFIGDILFTSSVAEKLKKQQDCQVDYLIHLIQPYRLLKQNPFIDNVHLHNCDQSQYDQVLQLGHMNHAFPPAQWVQMQAGIVDPTPQFKVYTLPEFDEWAAQEVANLRKDGKPVVACMDGWMEKTYKFTEEQYAAGIDVPNLGYGGEHRNIPYILENLIPYLTIVSVGKPAGFNVRTDANDDQYAFTASVIKHCDAFIGTDGGLATLAYGVGTKTILTGDFNLQLYGWNGVLEKNTIPQLGPHLYGGSVLHVEIDPFATDDGVIKRILTCLK
jgi:hypothetical protein